MDKLLTIAIPTYNRRKQLIRLLKSIESQGHIDVYNILISDNCSNYSVEDAINEEFSGAFREIIEVMRREINGGGDYNISSLFQYAKTKLLWIIGDDDELLPGAVEKILDNYEKYPEIPFFKYTQPTAQKFAEDIRMKSVDDFVMCHNKRYLGGVFFISNNIYNTELLKPYFADCLYYGYCSVSQIIPMMYCLIDLDKDVLLCKDSIVKYNEPEDGGWNYAKVVTSVSTVLDINRDNKHSEIEKFFRVICSYFGLGEFLLNIIRISDKSYRKYLYRKGMNTVYRHHRSIMEAFTLMCYKLEILTNLRFLTGFYVRLLNKQTVIRDKFKKKAESNENAAKLFAFLKRHFRLMQ